LQLDQLDPKILKELSYAKLAAIEVEELNESKLNESTSLINWIIIANYTVESLEALWASARARDIDLKLKDGLLLY
jgi:hypothetical protein